MFNRLCYTMQGIRYTYMYCMTESLGVCTGLIRAIISLHKQCIFLTCTDYMYNIGCVHTTSRSCTHELYARRHMHKSIASVHMYIHIHVCSLFTHTGVHYVRVQVTIPDKLGHAQHTLAINHEKNFKYKLCFT